MASGIVTGIMAEKTYGLKLWQNSKLSLLYIGLGDLYWDQPMAKPSTGKSLWGFKIDGKLKYLLGYFNNVSTNLTLMGKQNPFFNLMESFWEFFF